MAEVVLPALSTICTYQGQSNRSDRVASYLAKNTRCNTDVC